MNSIDRILELLREYSGPDVFNPWNEQASDDALPDEAERRRERLRAHFDCRPLALLLGEAPGFRGARCSGVPFSSESLIVNGRLPRLSTVFNISTRERPWSEPSATIVWSALETLGLAERTVMWNAFAWHPHLPALLLSNRTPTSVELQQARPVLQAVLDHFSGVPVVPVGLVAARALAVMGVASQEPVRHPARGGATRFRAELAALAAKIADREVPPTSSEGHRIES